MIELVCNLQIVTNSENTRESWRAAEKAHTAGVVASINHVRKAAGFTVEELAERLAENGWPVGVTTLNGILGSGKRASISLSELNVFARALGVPPLYLTLGLPDFPRESLLGLFGSRAVGAHELVDWATGKDPLGTGENRDLLYWETGSVLSNLSRVGLHLRAVRRQNSLALKASGSRMDLQGNRILAEYQSGDFTRLQQGLELLYDEWSQAWDDPNSPPVTVPDAIMEVFEQMRDGAETLALPLRGLNTPEELENARRDVAEAARAGEELP